MAVWLVHERFVDALEKGSGFFHHGHTYLRHPVACAATLAVQKVMQRDRLLNTVNTALATVSAKEQAIA
jgi:adenosylmethionine-8-amino-7-oxononanoate aminotransferase